MLLQYRDGHISVVFYGPVADVVPLCRTYDYSKNYELDISMARKQMGLGSPQMLGGLRAAATLDAYGTDCRAQNIGY